jgi:hypothetical protein
VCSRLGLEIVVAGRASPEDERGDGEQDARGDADPGEGARQGFASVLAGLVTMRYVQMSPARRVPVVKAAKQSR